MIRPLYALILTLFATVWSANVAAQTTQDSSTAFPFVRFQYSYLFPSGDYELTFGNTQTVGGALGFKTKSNWQFELEGSYMFGADVKRKDLLSDIINSAGDVTDADGELVRVILDIRAYSLFASVGKVFSVLGSNKNSGILVQAGVGFLQHRIKVDFRDGEVFQFSDDMLKGYDRLHRGIAFKQFIGYQFFGKKNLANFYLGFEFEEGITKNLREYNYDSREFDTEQKFDLLYGFRLGWAIPIKGRTADDFYYY